MSYKTYTGLKDSNVEWLGLIPEHWDVVSAKYCYSIQLGKMLQPLPVSSTDLQSPYLKALHVLWERILTDDLPTMWATASDMEKYEVLEGDLLVCEGGEVGRAGILGNLQERTIIQNSLHRIRSNKNNLKFLMYILRTIDEGGWFDVLCNKATISHLTGEKLGALHIPIPPKHEQDLIVNYVENRTAHVDELIGLKEKQIELLEIKRQAIISQAVTRGLNPDSRMKPSGLDWLGEIPEQWQTYRVKYLSKKIGSGRTPRGGAEIYSDDGIIFLRSQNVYDDGLRLQDVVFIDEIIDEEMVDTRVQSGDVLLNITGASIGRTCVVPEGFPRANVNQHVCIIRPKKESILNDFLAYCLKATSVKDQINSLENGSSRQGLNFEQIGNLLVVSPINLDEQNAIVNYLNETTFNLDQTIKLINEQIGLLQQYRQAIITSAVTGKIDLRGVEI